MHRFLSLVSFVLLFVASALDATGQSITHQPLFTITPESSDGYSGFAINLTTAGDVNDDGVQDLISGWAGGGNLNEFGSGGWAAVYSGADGTRLHEFLGTPPSASGGAVGFGESVSGAGDVNNDGYDDLIVADQWNVNASGEGVAYVFSGLNGSIIHTLTGGGDYGFERFGSDVSGAGDINGDGHADLLIGEPHFTDTVGGDAPFGRAHVISGADKSTLFTFDNPGGFESSGGEFANRVSNAGDVNGDGVNDFLIGNSTDNYFDNQEGRYVHYGSARVYSGANGQPLHTFFGRQTFSTEANFGRHLGPAGDVNADGFDDFLIGDVQEGDPQGPFTIRGRVFSGADGSVLQSVQNIRVAVDSAIFDGVGDVNGDGYDDVGYILKTGANIFSGLDGSLLFRESDLYETYDSETQPDFGRRSITGLGDIDGDSVDDFAVGHGSLFNQSVTVYASLVVPEKLGDFNQDGFVDADDIDFYSGNIGEAAEGELAKLDLDDDGTITLADHQLLVTTLLETSNGQVGSFLGDANADGQVNVLQDAFALVSSLGNSSGQSWSKGDFNADGAVNVLNDAFALISNLGNNNAASNASAATSE